MTKNKIKINKNVGKGTEWIIKEFLKNKGCCTIEDIRHEILVVRGKTLDNPKKDIIDCLKRLTEQGLVKSEFNKETNTRLFIYIGAKKDIR